ncbi:hypothetical protein EVAR_99519_1 [Eumeta japonica]|uniref:Uncharacterized protein n=1 Tax=Eumeta variegata TaxID=151549 RepID=A0A4C1SDH3_EUMVA|nr:hypothetical protein EVAR_99519_1 [Eumeta japonica]
MIELGWLNGGSRAEERIDAMSKKRLDTSFINLTMVEPLTQLIKGPLEVEENGFGAYHKDSARYHPRITLVGYLTSKRGKSFVFAECLQEGERVEP